MRLNKNEKEILINTLARDVEENPYDKEKRDLLKKLKKEIIATEGNYNTEKVELARFMADSFYDAGVLPTNDLSRLTEGDIRRAGFFGLTLKFEESNKKFFKTINENDFSNYEEFEPYLHDFIKEIVILGDKIRKTKVK